MLKQPIENDVIRTRNDIKKSLRTITIILGVLLHKHVLQNYAMCFLSGNSDQTNNIKPNFLTKKTIQKIKKM